MSYRCVWCERSKFKQKPEERRKRCVRKPASRECFRLFDYGSRLLARACVYVWIGLCLRWTMRQQRMRRQFKLYIDYFLLHMSSWFCRLFQMKCKFLPWIKNKCLSASPIYQSLTMNTDDALYPTCNSSNWNTMHCIFLAWNWIPRASVTEIILAKMIVKPEFIGRNLLSSICICCCWMRRKNIMILQKNDKYQGYRRLHAMAYMITFTKNRKFDAIWYLVCVYLHACLHVWCL